MRTNLSFFAETLCQIKVRSTNTKENDRQLALRTTTHAMHVSRYGILTVVDSCPCCNSGLFSWSGLSFYKLFSPSLNNLLHPWLDMRGGSFGIFITCHTPTTVQLFDFPNIMWHAVKHVYIMCIGAYKCQFTFHVLYIY